MCLVLLKIRFRLKTLSRAKDFAGDVMSSSEYHSRGHVNMACPIIGDVNFDHLVKVVTSRFPHW